MEVIEKRHIKLWVVKTASVTNPYKRYWSASVTIISDINGVGDTIEKAYNDLTDKINASTYILNQLKDYASFIKILEANKNA